MEGIRDDTTHDQSPALSPFAYSPLFIPPSFLPPLTLLKTSKISKRRDTERERYMERGKKPSSSIADELFGRKDATAPGDSSSSYFSSVFPPASTVMAKGSSQGDLYRTLNKQRTSGQIGNPQTASTAAGGKSQGSPSKKQTSSKDGKPVYPNQPEESAYFGSSVHYGGRDFYVSSPSNQTSGAPGNYRADEGHESGDANIATRGEWWQGSLYY